MKDTEARVEPVPGERDLIRGILEGDEQSYRLLINRYSGRLLSVARRITGNEADAQDCVQEAMVKCFTRIREFEGRSELGTWLHRIVVNASLMKLRTRKRSREDSLDELLPGFDEFGMRVEEAPLAETGGIERLYEQGRTQSAVRTAIDRLPDDYRAILVARDIEQMNTAETAKLLNISHSLVKTRLHRARAALKRLLEPVVRHGEI